MTNWKVWALRVLGIIALLLGLALTFGGVWLIALGGSWFYAIAGIAMIVIGFDVYRRRSTALWVAYGLLIVDLLWAFWEVGFDFWQLVPRIMVFLVFALVVSIISPALLKKNGAAEMIGLHGGATPKATVMHNSTRSTNPTSRI